MKSRTLLKHTLHDYVGESGIKIRKLSTSYEFFGNPHSSKKILLLHALTGNSKAYGHNGWWNSLIGQSKVIDTEEYQILAINFPGNGYENEYHPDYFHLQGEDLARLVFQICRKHDIECFHAVIGTSIGGMLVWQLAFQYPNLSERWIPVYSHYKSTDWIIGFNYIQKLLLNESDNHIRTSRMLAMLTYRSHESFEQKFYSRKLENDEQFSVESYLDYHGEKLQTRFDPNSYRLMLHYMNSFHPNQNNCTELQLFKRINGNIAQVFSDSDVLFPDYLIKRNHQSLCYLQKNSEIYAVDSIHGHDSFLIEQNQMSDILSKILN